MGRAYGQLQQDLQCHQASLCTPCVCIVPHGHPQLQAPSPSLASRIKLRASLVAQWLRICLLMQGTRVRALVWEDPTCHGAAGPVSHNY